MAEPTETTLSLAQLRDTLWADARTSVYAVVMGSRIADLPARLEAAGIDEWDRLWTGELDAAEEAAAPLLLALPQQGEFTGWLLGQAHRDFGPWGVLLLSSRPFLSVRALGRRLCAAVLPDGNEIRLDWMDPEVLQALLPLAPLEQLQALLGELDALLFIETARWTRCRLVMGRLEQRSSLVQVAVS